MSQLAMMTSRFFLRRKSQIYAALAFVLPAILLTGHAGMLVPLLVGALGATASVLLLPRYVKLMLQVEDAINLKLAMLTPGRLLRIGFHVPWVLGICQLLGAYWSSGPAAPFLPYLLVAASAGLHAVALGCAYRGHGDRVGNILLAFSLSAWLTAAALASPFAIYLAAAAGGALCWHLIGGLLSDLRARLYPRSGIGMFFGTFNPVHNTHLRILREALEQRRLHKIYVHPTTVPKLHRVALASGEIAMRYQDGMRVYHQTPLADPGKNYFPTGNKFYEYEVRKELLQAGIRDAGLEGRVEVLDLPHVYDRHGFFGIVRYIRQQHPDMPLHGLHGSDIGGIWVRHIFDAAGWIYPCPVARRDHISATAIRAGAVGYTSATVERFLAAARSGQDFAFPSGHVFTAAGHLTPLNRNRT